MLTRLSVRNFKILNDISTRLEPVNVIIGPNGAGKSSLLQAIDFLRAFIMYDSVQEYLKEHGWEYKDLPNLRMSNKVIRWELEAELPGAFPGSHKGTYRYLITLQPRRYLGIGQEHLHIIKQDGSRVPVLERRGRKVKRHDLRTGKAFQQDLLRMPASVMAFLESEDAERFPELFEFREWVSRFRSFLLWDPKVLRRPEQGKREELGPSGEYLASLLAHLQEDKPEAFNALKRRICSLFPGVSDIVVRGGGRKWGWRRIELVERGDKGVVSFNSQQISDGVLRLLAVTSFLYADNVPSLLTFEEPENGVHPQLLREVVQILRELTQREAPYGCQVLFTSHSPYVLDEFIYHPEQVQVMQRARPQEGARIAKLSDREDIEIIRKQVETLALGEVWLSGLLESIPNTPGGPTQ